MKRNSNFISRNGKFQSKSPSNSRKSKKRKKGQLLILILCLIALFLIALICVMLLTIREQKKFERLSEQVRENAQLTISTTEPLTEETDATQLEETPTTIPTTEPQMLAKYASLYAQNPDLLGWVTIEGTKIDYPVMYTPEDPEKYLHTNFEEQYSYAGVPFLEDSCSPESDNLIVYGHNMANGTMFRDLIQYDQSSFWEQHPTILFDTLYEEQEFEVMAAFYDRVYYKSENVFKFYQFIDAEDEESFDYAVEKFKEKSLYDTGVTAAYGDQLLTLVTCAYHVENGRFVVVARRTTEANELQP